MPAPGGWTSANPWDPRQAGPGITLPGSTLPQPEPEPAPAPAPIYDAPGAVGTPAMSASPAPTEQPAMQGLASVIGGENFRQNLMPEGWDVEQPPDFAVPGDRQLPPSTRALSQLASARGRVY